MSDEDPILICCPYCIRSLGSIEEPDMPFAVPAKCPRCGMDPRNDAPFEMTLSAWGRMPKRPCSVCGEQVPKLAVRCGDCKAATSSLAPAKKKSTTKTTAAAKPTKKATKKATKKKATKKATKT